MALNENILSFTPPELWAETQPRRGDEADAEGRRVRSARSLRRVPFYLAGSVVSFLLAEYPGLELTGLEAGCFWTGVGLGATAIVSYSRAAGNAGEAHQTESGQCAEILPLPPNWPDATPRDQG